MDIGGVTLCMLWRGGDLEQVAAYKSGHSASVRLQGRRRCGKRLLVLGRITAFKANLNLLIGVSCILSRAAGRNSVAVTDADDKAEEGGGEHPGCLSW